MNEVDEIPPTTDTVGHMSKGLVRIYTDGSAHFKTGHGAWAYIVVHPNGAIEEHCKAYKNVTNNKMELCAVLEALDYIVRSTDPEKHGSSRPRYEIISDSEYCVNGINEWIKSWKKKKWKDVKNLPLWIAIDSALNAIKELELSLTVSWVRGHNGDTYNEMCDKLAHATYKKFTQDEIQRSQHNLQSCV